jgi:hypothetical protein
MGAPLFSIRFYLALVTNNLIKSVNSADPAVLCTLLAQMSALCEVAQHEREMISRTPIDDVEGVLEQNEDVQTPVAEAKAADRSITGVPTRRRVDVPWAHAIRDNPRAANTPFTPSKRRA